MIEENLNGKRKWQKFPSQRFRQPFYQCRQQNLCYQRDGILLKLRIGEKIVGLTGRTKRILLTPNATPEMAVHEISHVLLETLPKQEQSIVLGKYVKAGKISDWEVKNKFHYEKFAIDLTDYISGKKQSPELKIFLMSYFQNKKDYHP